MTRFKKICAYLTIASFFFACEGFSKHSKFKDDSFREVKGSHVSVKLRKNEERKAKAAATA